MYLVLVRTCKQKKEASSDVRHLGTVIRARAINWWKEKEEEKARSGRGISRGGGGASEGDNGAGKKK